MRRYEGPIEVGMILTSPDNDGVLGWRRVRVLAEYPEGGWIIEDLPCRLLARSGGLGGRLGRIPDENLRIVFVPEDEAPDVHDDPEWSPKSAERFGVQE